MAETAEIQVRLEDALRTAIVASFGAAHADADPAVRPSQNPDHGDFQCNAAMALAKPLGMKPRDVAAQIVAAAMGETVERAMGEGASELAALCEPPEIAGPGFINLRLRPEALAAQLVSMDTSALGVAPIASTHAIVIDLCGVNVAKQLHVGHLRATVIGDCLARIFERLGRKVWRENHLGDWGLPIAMVLWRMRHGGIDLDRLTLDDLNRAYRAGQAAAKDDRAGLEAAHACGCGPHRIAELEEQNAGALEAQEAARTTLVALQGGDEGLAADWRKMIEVTMREMYESSRILGVKLGPEHERGESFFRDRLAATVKAFVDAGLAAEDDGALVVRFADRERPLLIRKRDGGFLYATTDLSAIRRRVQDIGADEVVYCVDARQSLHFKQVFAGAHKAGYTTKKDGTVARLEHAAFGTILGEDGRPFKTRSGENVKLSALRFRVQELDGERVIYVVDARQRDHFRDVFDAVRQIGWDTLRDGTKADFVHIGFGAVLGRDRRPLKTRSGENFTLQALLDEAVTRGRDEVRRRAADPTSPTHGLDPATLDETGRAVGIAAIKYADLGSDLVRDYVFDLDRMVAFEGDTGPYLQYAHARTCSILARAGFDAHTLATAPFPVAAVEERRLALALLRYPQIVAEVARTLEPHRLCGYLRSLAEHYSAFYNACPVLKAESESLRNGRLRLCDLARRTLRDGLDLLGIEAPERM